jgi:ATP-dependent Zn protease
MTDILPAELLTAYHEAGHAVVALHHNLPVQRVSIVEDDDSHGHVLSHNPLHRLREYESDPMRIERAMRRRSL